MLRPHWILGLVIAVSLPWLGGCGGGDIAPPDDAIDQQAVAAEDAAIDAAERAQ